MRAFVTGGGGLHRQQSRDRLLADGCAVVAWDNFSPPARSASWKRRGPTPPSVSSGATISTSGPHAGHGRLRHRLPSGGQCRRALRSAASGQGSGAKYHRDFPRAGSHARQRRQAHRLFVDGIGLRRDREIPTPEDAPFPVQTSLYGASKLAGEGMIAAYCEGLWLRGIYFPLRLDPRRTVHARTRVRFLPATRRPSRAPRRARRRHAAQIVSPHRRLRRGGAACRPRGHGERRRHRTQIYNLGTEEHCGVSDSIGWICAELGVQPELRFAGGSGAGWGTTRSSFSTRRKSAPRVGGPALHPGRGRAHGPVVAREHLGFRAAEVNHESHHPRSLAPWQRHGGLLCAAFPGHRSRFSMRR